MVDKLCGDMDVDLDELWISEEHCWGQCSVKGGVSV